MKNIKHLLSSHEDLGAGILFLLFGAGAAIQSGMNYRVGTVERMGPGFFPLLVGITLFILGLIITVVALRRGAGEVQETPGGFRQLAIVTLSVAVFAVLLNTLGLFVAIAAMVLVARLAQPARLVELVLLLIVLCVIAWAVFVLGLGMNFVLVPW